jgi:hypothetical protein
MNAVLQCLTHTPPLAEALLAAAAPAASSAAGAAPLSDVVSTAL